MNHTHGKGQDQRSVGSKDRMETEEAGDCITFRANAVGNNQRIVT